MPLDSLDLVWRYSRGQGTNEDDLGCFDSSWRLEGLTLELQSSLSGFFCADVLRIENELIFRSSLRSILATELVGVDVRLPEFSELRVSMFRDFGLL